ncbi:MAG: cation-translocating P-type ATPase, partial [Anaerolineae bacterium]|nr:cation-translocating P-type ATPase [Anaerolineae bacterium]
MAWYQLSVEETTQKLNTNIKTGLESKAVEQRQGQYGPNELVDRGSKNPWLVLLKQFTEVLVVILIIAAAISLFLGEFVDAIVILLIVLLTGILGFVQEMRAEQSMAALKKMAVPNVRVRRAGHVQEIPSPRLVPGDVVLLEAGNLVPADSRLVESVNLKVQESALTGESEPVAKAVAVPSGENLAVGDQRDMLFMGTVVTYGRGEAVVVETGMNTELGNIAGLIQDVEDEQTPLQRRLAGLGKTLAWLALIIIAVVVFFGWLRGEDLELLFLTGVSLAVAAIPESLPAVVTITLALGSQKLLKRNALIRQLPAVETLGSVTVICSDKTGTLTENRMTVTMLDVAGNTQDLKTLVNQDGVLLEADFTADTLPELNALNVLVRAGALCNDAILETENGVERAIGDPTEGALVLAAKQLGYNKIDLEKEWPRVAEVPFTSERKRMTTVHQMSDTVKQTDLPWRDTPYVLLSKGAVDSLLQVTDRVLVNNQIVPLDDTLRDRINEANAQFAQQGQRVLGVAFRFWDTAEFPEDDTLLEANEVFVGLVAMIDPPRPEVKEAVAVAKTAGIRPVMITGDHPLTAQQIAKDLGITASDRYITGRELARMSLTDLERQVADVSVYARVAPEHKLNIVDALQNKGEIVSMTGDGVNDAPALKQADIGVAMGITGTDVSKEASDMVLLDDNFATIVAAVEEGRVIYDNIRKFIKYALSSNAGELLLMLLGPLVGMPLPLLPLQILWINLATDGLPGIALAQEPAERGVMKRPPFHPQESIFSRGLGLEIIWIGSLVAVVSLGVGFWSWQMDPAGPWQTMIFTTLVLAQMGNVLAIRSNRESLFQIGL